MLLSPEKKAFGVIIPVNLQRMPRSQFAMDLEEGMVISFADIEKTNFLPLPHWL